MSHFSHYAAAFNLLGTCFLFAPDDDANRPTLRFFQTDFASQWPCSLDVTMGHAVTHALNVTTKELARQWQHLFVGPQALSAPPWGSVYLDNEGLLHGDSTLALAAFLEKERLNVQTPFPEPVDHIGLMLFQAAVLASQQRESALTTLLTQHLLSWLPLYLARLKQAGKSPFYQYLTELTLLTVKGYLK